MSQMILGSRLMRPPTDADGSLSIVLTRRDEIISSGASYAAVVNDANVNVVTPATTDTAWDVSISAIHLGRQVPVSVSVSGSGVLTGTRLTRVSDGDCTITASTGMFTKRETVAMLRSSGQTVNQWQSWVPGCLAAAIQDMPNVALPFWRGTGYGFTAISPRHVIGCEHIYFMPPTLTLGGVTRNLVNTAYVGPANSADGWKSDLMVGLYDGDFPSFAKVFPSTLIAKMPSTELKGVPVILCNQLGQRVQRVTRSFQSSASKMYFSKINPSDQDIVGGDSGNPAFMVLNGEPVLLGTLTYGGTGGLTTVHDQIAEINAAMSALGGGYQLAQVNLSGYPSYV